MIRKHHKNPNIATALLMQTSNQPFTEEEVGEMVNPVRMAFERLRMGEATDADYDSLAAGCNIATVCAEKIDKTVLQVCLQARDALFGIDRRRKETGLLRLDGQAVTELTTMIDVLYQLLCLMTSGQLVRAVAEADQRLKGKR